MGATALADNAYLKRRRGKQRSGFRWYVRVPVPTDIQETLHKQTIERALNTSDIKEARRLKLPVLAEIFEGFERTRGRRITSADRESGGLFMKTLTRDRVVQIISANISWLILAITGSSSLLGRWLFFIVVFALVLPAVFHQSELRQDVTTAQRLIGEQAFSIGASIILLLVYSGNLVFTLITHRDVFRNASPEPGQAKWTLLKSLAILATATASVAVCTDFVASALKGAAEALHIPLLFLGVVPLALIGTAADLFASVAFARQDKMGLAMTISIGSAIQIGRVVAPLLVLIS